MRKMETTGNLDFLRKRYSGSKTCKQPVNEKPLGFEKLSFLFFMLIIGCMMSIFVVFFEYITQTKKKKQEITNEEVMVIQGKIAEYLEGLTYQDTKNILDGLFLQKITKE